MGGSQLPPPFGHPTRWGNLPIFRLASFDRVVWISAIGRWEMHPPVGFPTRWVNLRSATL